jgi:hypothetical protein
MKRLFAVLMVSSVVTLTGAFAQDSTLVVECEPDAVIASFAEAVAAQMLDEWVSAYTASDCEAPLRLAALELVEIYESMQDPAPDSNTLAQWASRASATSEYDKDSWSAMQATGEPDTRGCGDLMTAWASATATEQAELTVMFDEAVIPSAINIYQTYNPGSITQVAVIDAETGDLLIIEDSADMIDSTPCPRVHSIVLKNDEESPVVNGVVITLDQSIGGGWNEIDAVELIGWLPE